MLSGLSGRSTNLICDREVRFLGLDFFSIFCYFVGNNFFDYD